MKNFMNDNNFTHLQAGKLLRDYVPIVELVPEDPECFAAELYLRGGERYPRHRREIQRHVRRRRGG